MSDLDFKRVQLLYEQNNQMIREMFHSREKVAATFLIIIFGLATFVTASEWSIRSIHIALLLLLVVSVVSVIIEFGNKIYLRKLYDNGEKLEKKIDSQSTGPISFFSDMYKNKWYRNRYWISAFIVFYGAIGLFALISYFCTL
jgi:multisubunit Na+/H+ antiporter MnhG subunit